MTRIPFCALLLLVLAGCESTRREPGSDHVIVRRQQHMATTVTISVAAPESIEAIQAIEAAFAEIARLTEVLSEWRPHSEISQISQQAGVRAVQISAEPLDVLQAANGISVASQGAFDVTCGPLFGLWDFRSKQPHVPSADALQQRLPLVDYHKLELDRSGRTAFLQQRGMQISLGGIAKGYVVDRASAVLKQKGFADHLVSAGGDMYASGRRGSRKWTIGIYHPHDKRVVSQLELENEGVATSGNYERFFIIDGTRYHHILDPRTGMPVRGLSSVTVVARNAMLADGFATAVFVLGQQRGVELARQQGFEVFAFDEAFAPVTTAGLRARIRPLGTAVAP